MQKKRKPQLADFSRQKSFLQKHRFELLWGGILFFSALLRFYDFAHRWTLASDQAGFAIIARYALATGQLPLLGPFSSAGPFQTGGEWYWMIMIGKALFYPSIVSPWVFMTLLSIVFVAVMMFVGTKLINKPFGLLVGLLTAVSTGQIIQSVNLTNQTPLMLFSAAALYCSVKYTREKKPLYLFFLGLSVGLASSVHLQGVALGMIILITLIINRVMHPVSYGYILLGGFIPWIPVLAVDSQNNYYTVQNMVHYYFFNSDRIPFEALGRRWITFAGVFVPSAWAYTVGGLSVIGYLFILLSGMFFTVSILKKQLKKEWLIIFFSLLGMIFLLRYTRTPIFESYFVFIHPFILLISAWCIFKMYYYNKAISVFFCTVVITLSLYRDYKEARIQADYYTDQIIRTKEYLKSRYPGEKFSLYDFQYKTTSFTLPLTLYMFEEDLLTTDGRRIGIIGYENRKSHVLPPQPENVGGVITDLSASTGAQLKYHGWVSTDPKYMYDSVQNWYREKR